MTKLAGYAHAIDLIGTAVLTHKQIFVYAANPEKAERARCDMELSSALASADIGLCDGIGIAVAARLLCGQRIRRCTGVELAERLLHACELNGWSIYFLGAHAAILERAVDEVARRYPRLPIAGHHHGYFEESGPIIDEINFRRPDVTLVALGSPRQEKWIAQHRAELRSTVLMGVGGTFDVLAGHSRRAPRSLQRLGLEFLFRLLAQPQRAKRQAALPRFALRVALESVSGRVRVGNVS